MPNMIWADKAEVLPRRMNSEMIGGVGAISIEGWRIYYGDDSLADSRLTTWRDCASNDVQVIVVFYRERYKTWQDNELREYPYRLMLFGGDYYWQWGTGSAEDAERACAQFRVESVESFNVKLGRELAPDDWRRVYDRAFDDLTFE